MSFLSPRKIAGVKIRYFATGNVTTTAQSLEDNITDLVAEIADDVSTHTPDGTTLDSYTINDDDGALNGSVGELNNSSKMHAPSLTCSRLSLISHRRFVITVLRSWTAQSILITQSMNSMPRRTFPLIRIRSSMILIPHSTSLSLAREHANQYNELNISRFSGITDGNQPNSSKSRGRYVDSFSTWYEEAKNPLRRADCYRWRPR